MKDSIQRHTGVRSPSNIKCRKQHPMKHIRKTINKDYECLGHYVWLNSPGHMIQGRVIGCEHADCIEDKMYFCLRCYESIRQ